MLCEALRNQNHNSNMAYTRIQDSLHGVYLLSTLLLALTHPYANRHASRTSPIPSAQASSQSALGLPIASTYPSHPSSSVALTFFLQLLPFPFTFTLSLELSTARQYHGMVLLSTWSYLDCFSVVAVGWPLFWYLAPPLHPLSCLFCGKLRIY